MHTGKNHCSKKKFFICKAGLNIKQKDFLHTSFEIVFHAEKGNFQKKIRSHHLYISTFVSQNHAQNDIFKQINCTFLKS